MSYRGGVVTGALGAFLVAGAAGAGWWALNSAPGGSGKATPAAVPAAVPKVAKEDQFAAVTLTPEAEQRLGVKTGTVARKPVKRVRVYGAEVTVPVGKAVVVTAPVAGLLQAPPGGVPAVGAVVPRGKPVFRLLPLLTPEGRANLTASRVEADGQVNNARTQVEAAKIALDRSKRLLAGEAGSRRLVDEAQAQADLAQKTLDAATARRDLLTRVVGEVEGGTAAPMSIDAPEDGLLRAESAMPGQTVPAGAPLFEVVDLSAVWVRVPVYVGDLPDLDPAAPAAVGPLTARPSDPSRPAAPVPAPPTANGTAGTADFYYELDNRETKYRPGQRVSAAVPLRGDAEGLTVPWSAVLFDINGGAWVYERTGDRAYNRRRITVRHVLGGDAVLADGPAAGTTVVTAGAAELFGTETGFSK